MVDGERLPPAEIHGHRGGIDFGDRTPAKLGQIDGIVMVLPVDRIDIAPPGTGEQKQVVPVVADQGVVAPAADEDIMAVAPIQQVVTGIAIQQVGATVGQNTRVRRRITDVEFTVVAGRGQRCAAPTVEPPGRQQSRPCLARPGSEGDVAFHLPKTDFQVPIAPLGFGPGEIVTGGHVRSGEGTQGAQQRLAGIACRQFAAVEQQVRPRCEAGPPALDGAVVPGQALGGQPPAAQLHPPGITVGDQVDGIQPPLAGQAVGDLFDAVPIRVQDHDLQVAPGGPVTDPLQQPVVVWGTAVDEDDFTPVFDPRVRVAAGSQYMARIPTGRPCPIFGIGVRGEDIEVEGFGKPGGFRSLPLVIGQRHCQQLGQRRRIQGHAPVLFTIQEALHHPVTQKRPERICREQQARLQRLPYKPLLPCRWERTVLLGIHRITPA